MVPHRLLPCVKLKAWGQIWLRKITSCGLKNNELIWHRDSYHILFRHPFCIRLFALVFGWRLGMEIKSCSVYNSIFHPLIQEKLLKVLEFIVSNKTVILWTITFGLYSALWSIFPRFDLWGKKLAWRQRNWNDKQTVININNETTTN